MLRILDCGLMRTIGNAAEAGAVSATAYWMMEVYGRKTYGYIEIEFLQI